MKAVGNKNRNKICLDDEIFFYLLFALNSIEEIVINP